MPEILFRKQSVKRKIITLVEIILGFVIGAYFTDVVCNYFLNKDCLVSNKKNSSEIVGIK